MTDFERETRLLARISDPGIVQIYDVGHSPEGRYYVSSSSQARIWPSGCGGARSRRGRRPASPRSCAGRWPSAHAQRIVHRDVKPPNILLSSSGQVKVGDFGVAGLAEGSSGAGSQTIVGTPSYMAPEQSRGRPVSPATDVYSAGVVLYEMVSGALPFAAGSAVELAVCHLQDPPPPLPASVPEPLREIIARALAKDPAQTLRRGGEMADALVDASRRAGERARERSGRSGGRGRLRARTGPRSATPSTAVMAGVEAGAPGGPPGRGDGAGGPATRASGRRPGRVPAAADGPGRSRDAADGPGRRHGGSATLEAPPERRRRDGPRAAGRRPAGIGGHAAAPPRTSDDREAAATAAGGGPNGTRAGAEDLAALRAQSARPSPCRRRAARGVRARRRDGRRRDRARPRRLGAASAMSCRRSRCRT